MRKIAFFALAILVVMMIAATVVEQFYGSEFAINHLYTSPIAIALWAAVGTCGMLYLLRKRIHKRPTLFALHTAFVVILLGAAVTHFAGQQGSIHLRVGEEQNQFIHSDGTTQQLPFGVELQQFEVEYYTGTRAPMDYASIITFSNHSAPQRVSMNRIVSHKHYRFYQSSYDDDMKGTTLTVSYDPYGIAITYLGYLLLLISMSAMLAQKFLTAKRSASLRTTTIALLITIGASATAAPQTIDKRTAEAFDQLYIYYNHRICPMSTLTSDVCTKICGRNTYNNLSSTQVVMGLLLHYESWKHEEMIKIKGDDVKASLGIEGKYAKLSDFIGPQGYKLEHLLKSGNKNARIADEKFNLTAMVCTGSIFTIYPVCDSLGQLHWYSWSETLPRTIHLDDWKFIKGSMNYVVRQLAHGNATEAQEALQRIRQYQQREEIAASLPSKSTFKAETIYQKLRFTKPLAMTLIALGLMLLIYTVFCITNQHSPKRWVRATAFVFISVVALYLATMLGLRGYVSGHWPMANGYETMQFLACITAVVTLLIQRRNALLLPFGYIVCGAALMVSMMGEANPQITNLIPVLASPLLSIHVAIIMIAYMLLAFLMLNSATALLLHYTHKNTLMVTRLYQLGQLLLYPAIFCLTVGIFVGAVWANVSWGRYWGWDPKEVWALITLLVYAAAMHKQSLPAFRRELFFHWFCLLAFACVLFTYFGVNYLLGGLHSYA